jgi:hypothetical protein
MLAALVLIGQVINLRPVFIHASPELYDLLTLAWASRRDLRPAGCGSARWGRLRDLLPA